MIRGTVLEAAGEMHLKIAAQIAEPESRGIEQMRTQVWQNASSLVAPRRFAHQAGRAVSVEHSAVVRLPQRSGGDELAHAQVVRLETMVVSGVANGLVVARKPSEALDVLIARCPQGFFHQDVLALREQVFKQLQLRLVGGAYQRG